MVMEGGGAVEVGGVSFRIGVDLSSFERDLGRAEELARSRVAQMQQHFDSLRMGAQQSAQSVQRSVGQLELPDMSQAAQRFQQRMADVQALQRTQVRQETSYSPAPTPPQPSAPPPVEHIRRVTTRNYHTTEAGGGPEPVYPPAPITQQRTIATRDVRTSTAPQETPPPPAPTPVQQPRVIALPAPPPSNQQPLPLTSVHTAWGQDIHVPSAVSAPVQTQRQIPSRISGVPPTQKPLVNTPASPSAPPAALGSSATPPPPSTPPVAPAVQDPGLSRSAAALTVAAQQIQSAADSLKGQIVKWTGAAGAELSGRVTSEKGGALRVNVGGATHTVARERVSPLNAPTVSEEPVEQAALPSSPPPVSAAPRGPRLGPQPVRPVFSVPSTVSATPPTLPRFGQQPRVHFEPQEGGAVNQAAYVLAPQGIYQTETPVGIRRTAAQQVAFGNYFSGAAQKVPATQFPPYARFLAQQQQLQSEYDAAPAARATRAPTQVPGAAPSPPERIRAPRTYEFERGRFAIRLTTGSEGASLQRARLEEGGSQFSTGSPPLSRSEAARQLREARSQARRTSDDPGKRYTEPEIVARARGGDAQPGRIHLVGERGPELFVPREAGYVLSHEQSKQAVKNAIHRAVGGSVQGGLFGGEQPKRQLPAFGTVLKKSRRRAQPTTGFDVSQPDLFGGAGKERGEGATRAEQMQFARQEMFDFGAPSLFEAPVAPRPDLFSAPVAQPPAPVVPEVASAPEPTKSVVESTPSPKGVPGWKPSVSETSERIGKIARLSSIRKRAAGGRVTPADQVKPSVARQIATAHLEQFGLRPAHEIGAMLGAAPMPLPQYMRPVQQFITQQSERLAAGKLTPSEVSSAYLITLSSIRGGERPRAGVERQGVFPASVIGLTAGRETIRPEDAFAHWLDSGAGQHIQQLVNTGHVDEAQRLLYEGLGKRFRDTGFGFPQLKPRKTGKPETAVAFAQNPDVINLRNIQAATEQLNRTGAAGGSIEPIAARFAGIGAGKTGFLSQFLGSGRYPTMDINALQTWFGSERMGSLAQRGMGSSEELGWRLRHHITSRQHELQSMGYLHDVPQEQLPALMHHALFDAAKRAETSHQAIIDAITAAGHRQAGGPVDVTAEITSLTRGQKAAATRARRRAMGVYQRSAPSQINPFLANTKPGPGLVKLSQEELYERNDELYEMRERVEEQISSLQSRLEGDYYAAEEAVGGVQRPPWATGIPSAALVRIAKEHGQTATDPNWWGKAGLYGADVGEFQDVVKSVGSTRERARGTATGARRELEEQQAALQHITAAMDHIASGGELYKPATAAAVSDLPFGPSASQRLRASIDAGVTTAGLATTFAIPSVGALRGDIAARSARAEPLIGAAAPQQLALPAASRAAMVALVRARTQASIQSRVRAQRQAQNQAILAAATSAPAWTPPTVTPPVVQPAPMAVPGGLPQRPAEGFATVAELEAFEARERAALIAREAASRAALPQTAEEQEAETRGLSLADYHAFNARRQSAAARRASTQIAPRQLTGEQQQQVNAIDHQVAQLGTSDQPSIQRRIGHLRLLRTMIVRGVSADDIPDLLRTTGLSREEVDGLQSLVEGATVGNQPSPADAMHMLTPFERQQQAVLRKYAAVSSPRSAPRTRAPQAAPTVGVADITRSISQQALQHLQSYAQPTVTEILARGALQSGIDIDELSAHLQRIGTSRNDSEALVNRLVTETAVSKPGLLGRFMRRIGLAREQGGQTGPRAYWVGETGPEIFVPGATGYVLAHEQARRAVSEGRLGRMGHRQLGGVTEQDAIRYLQSLAQPQGHEAFSLQLLRTGQVNLGSLAQALQQGGGLRANEATNFVQNLERQAHPTIGPLTRQIAVQQPATAQAAQAAIAGPGATNQAAQNQLTTGFQRNFQALQQLNQSYLQAAGASREYAAQQAREVTVTQLVQQRTQQLTGAYTALTDSRTVGQRTARQQAETETRQLVGQADEQQRRQRSGGASPFGQTATLFLREVAAIAGINLGFNVMVGLARQVHDILSDTVDQSNALSRSTAQIGVAFGGAGGAFRAGGFQQFQAAPLTAQTQAQFQQTAVALAPLQQQYELTGQQVQQLTTDSAQLAQIWGVDQPQAAQVLQQVIRGQVQAGQQLNLNLVDQYGRIRQLGVSYEELASVIGPAAASQRVLAVAQQSVNQQVSAFQQYADPQTQQLVELSQEWSRFQTVLGQVAASPVTSFLQNLNELLAQTSSLMGGAATQANQGGQPTGIYSGFAQVGTQPQAGRAAGGGVGIPGAYLVGEKGPELFVPNQAGYVHSNADTAHILGRRQEGGPVEALRQLADTPAAKAALAALLAPLAAPIAPVAATGATVGALAQNPLGRVALGAVGGGTLAAGLGAGVLGIGAAGVVGGAAAQFVAPTLFRQGQQAGGQALANVAGVAADKLQGLDTAIGDTDRKLNDWATTLPQPLQQLVTAVTGAAEGVRQGVQAAEQAAQGAAQNPPGQPAPGPVSRPREPVIPPTPPSPFQAAETAATLAQSRAQRFEEEATARIQQAQAEQALRLYDVNQSNLSVDGQRVSAADALNRIRMEQLPVEQRLQATQLEAQRIQDQITIGTQEDLNLRRQVLQAQRTQVGTGAAVTQIGLEQRRDILQAQLAITGQAPGVDIGQLIQNMFQRAVFQQPNAELADVNAQLALNTATAASSTDQLTKQLSVIPLQQQQQQLERATLMYQEQNAALQSQSDTINRMLEFANLVAAPSVLAAQQALAKAQLDAANAWEQKVVPILNQIPGVNLQPQKNTGAATVPQFNASTAADQAGQAALAAGLTLDQASAVAAQAYQSVQGRASPAGQSTTLQVTIAPARAAGGSAGMGGAYLVGEAGPELFVPNQSGYVYSNKQSVAMLGARQAGGPVFGGLSMWDAGSPDGVGAGGLNVNLYFGDVTIGQAGVDMDTFSQTVTNAAIAGTLQLLQMSGGISQPRVNKRVAAAR